MKSFMKMALGLFAGMWIMTACNDSDDTDVTAFALGTKEITLGAEGGQERISIFACGKWVVKCDQPWVTVLPANGMGPAECEVRVDTTLTNDVRHAVVSFLPEGQAKQELQVHQTGYGKMIGLSRDSVAIENMGVYGKRFFEITVTSNIAFKVTVPAEASWLKAEASELVLDYGARPRTVKVRFDWSMNTDPEVRKTAVVFEPENEGEELEQIAQLVVEQEAAPVIEDSRKGDSLALIIIGEKLRTLVSWTTTERMEYWNGVTLWEKGDKGVQPEMLGRVRSVSYRLMNTKEGLPKELGYLKYVETLSFYGNTNTMLLPDKFEMGEALAGLEYLKHLQIAAYGITGIEPLTELEKPRLILETLDLSNNNFTALPAAINKNNFPNLKSLSLNGMRRYSSLTDLRESAWNPNGGMRVPASSLTGFLRWEELEELRLSHNYIYGELPALAWDDKYTDADIAANDTLKSASPGNQALLKKIPRILPNIKVFSMNLNFLTGALPDWLLYHPRFARFNPFALICTQEDGYDPNGKVPGFTNEPVNLEYFYEFYPAAKPVKTE